MVGESNLFGQFAKAASVYREQPIRTGSNYRWMGCVGGA